MILLLVIVATAWLLHSYIDTGAVNFLLGICVLPFLSQPGIRRVRFGWFLLFELLLTACIFFLPVATFLYVAGMGLILYTINAGWGNRIVYILLVMLLMSPVASYLASVFTFPIRIAMTEVAGSLLKWLGGDIVTLGNTLRYNGVDYTVDAACMGLKMLEVSLITGLFLAVHFEKRSNRKLPLFPVFGYLLLVFFLNMVCNLFRILILVLMGWMPGTLLHEITGIVCFVMYVVAPAVYLSRRMTSVFGKEYTVPVQIKAIPSSLFLKQGILLLLIFFVGGFQLKYGKALYDSTSQLRTVNGYQLEESAPGIWKYFNGSTLVYVKSVRGFFDTDHQPMLCWKGSGYVFSHVQAAALGDNRVYMAELKKENNCLYSAWWYSNGKRSTLSQWNWRSEMLKGSAPYYLVNVTSFSSESLKKAITEWHGTDWLPLNNSSAFTKTKGNLPLISLYSLPFPIPVINNP
ncbi:MAG: exosortase N [Chitinophagaceae bacterium]